MIPFFGKLFDSNDKEVKRLQTVATEINSLEPEIKKLKDKDFVKKTAEFKERIAGGESLDAILPEAFALAREAARRTIGMRHFDVQLMAATALAHGKIAEQKTGEGKTMSAVPALYLHSLTGKNVHLVTVNDYLARRDAGWMGPVFDLLGVTVASMINSASYVYDATYINPDTTDPRLQHLRQISRKEAYQADITYGINSEFGFDYLRDNMAQDSKDVVQRDYYFAIVDEVDSVLIDEARTPHIISAPDEAPSEKYYEYAKVVEKLSSETDYKIDEKLRTAHLTDHGISKIEKMYGIQDVYEKDFETVYHLEAALKARTLFRKEKDYIVRENQVILVDEFTGRLMEGRRLSEGIHQAIEAKEGVPIQRESKTLATVSLQNYFRMYTRLAGMTGTAVTEAEEFQKIYKLDVVTIPTNNAVKRQDLADAVYKTTRAKYSAVVDAIAEAHKRGQPVLVGTTSIEKNEIISQLLKRRGIKHEVLNAKNHIREAQIIALAGKKSAVTVATNMAGRGVDIVLGGDSADQSSDKKKWQKEHDEIVKFGGLFVLGTERHESRRIDNQLRGRSGRQGDPGTSRFYVSLDDDIMRLFGGDRIAGLMTRFNMPEDVPLEHPLVSRAIENAQVKVEGFNFDIRKHLVEYDDVLNKQREIIYKLRRDILEKSGTSETFAKDEVFRRIDASLATMLQMASAGSSSFDNYESQNAQIIEGVSSIIPFDETSQKQLVTQLEQFHTVEEKTEFLVNLSHDLYEQKEKQVGAPLTRQVEKIVMLSSIDRLWMDHLDAIDDLRQGIGLRGYAQKDPLVEYKNEAYRMFEQLVFAIDDEIVHRIFKVSVQTQEHDHNHDHQHIEENVPLSEISQIGEGRSEAKVPTGNYQREQKTKGKNKAAKIATPVAAASVHAQATTASSSAQLQKPGRNDPCWCGSGKKYKKCHGK